MRDYDVEFIDSRDGCINHKILSSQSIELIEEYMNDFGHVIIRINER